MDTARTPRKGRPPFGPDAKAILIAAAALLALLPAWWMLATFHSSEQSASEKKRITDMAAPYRDALARSFEKRIALLDALQAFVHAHPDRRELHKNFDAYASGLFSATGGIRALELMPGGMAEYVFPLAGNERIAGRDLFRDQARRFQQRSLKSGRVTLTDPMPFEQGGEAMIAGKAVYEGTRFWGFVAVVLDHRELLEEAGLANSSSGIELALKDRSGKILSGSEAVFRANPILQTVRLAEGQWTLAAIPAGGWGSSIDAHSHYKWFTLAIAGLISVVVYFLTERHSHLSRALVEGDRRYRAVTDALPVVIAFVDREERYQFSNHASQQWFDRVSAGALGKPLSEVLGTATYERVKPEIESALAGRPASFEMTAPASDGAVRYLRAVCVPRFVGAHHPNGFYLLITDVTELKTAERAAVGSRDFLQRLLEDFPALVWRSGPDGSSLYFNRSWQEFTGSVAGQASWEASVHPDDLPKRAAAYRAAHSARAPFEMEYRLRNGDGEYRLVLDIAKPFTDADGKLQGYLGSCYDITGRKRTEEALKRSNSTLQAVIEASPLAIVMLDPNGAVLSWNDAACRTFGFALEEVLGERIPIVTDENSPELAAGTLGAVAGVEQQRLRKDGSTADVSIWTAPMKDEHGETLAIVAIYADVTERKQLELQFRQSQKMEAIGRLAGGVAHDFNNLLSIIAGYGHMLKLGLPPDERLHHDLGEILKAGERASDLTKQLLSFSRRQHVQTKVIDLNACIGEMEHMLRRLIGEDIDLRILPGRNLGRINGDPSQIEQVILNLAVNARDAMPHGGTLTIETANVQLGRNTHQIMLAVADTGVGMDAETQSRIFEPFFTTKERGKGTGLGLSTVYGIVEQCGGNIQVFSQPGKGTTFVIYFPQSESAGTVDTAANPSATAEAGVETILLVEDEPGVRKLVREILQRAGYCVLEAGNAGEALLICEQHTSPIHLMLSDVVMPRMGGGELAKRLAPLRKEMRVLFMSGYMDDAIVKQGIQESGMAFLQKPLAPGTLLRKIREVLDSVEIR